MTVADEILIPQLANIGPWGLITLFVLAVFFGYLIPRWTHKQRISDKEDEIKFLRETLGKKDEQLQTAINNNELVVKALEDIKRRAATI